VTAMISNCVLVGNSADGPGGGACGGTLNNCTLAGNSNSASTWMVGYGGGAYASTLNNCVLTGNSANNGGGAAGCTLNNCTVTGNSAYGVGGALGGPLNNRIVYANTSSAGSPFVGPNYDGLLNYSCTTPMPSDGVGNITNAPLFLDAAHGDFRLQANSPCINAGNNAYASGSTDLDGLARVVSGTVDIGAYEFRSSGSVISYAWLQDHGLPADGSADFADPDTDGLNTWQEWRCLTDPTNALSVLRLLSATPAATGVTVSWPGVNGVIYFLERSTDLGASPLFSPLATNLFGPSGTHTFTDTNAATSPAGFYRVGVRP